MADKETLIAEVEELRAQLVPQMERDRALALAEGRKFNLGQWLSGAPFQNKYPSGPGFLPKGSAQEVTMWTGVTNMDSRDWLSVAVGSAALYATGFSFGASPCKGGERRGVGGVNLLPARPSTPLFPLAAPPSPHPHASRTAPSPPPPAAPYLGVKNGHRLGFWAAVPAALVGLVAGHRTGVFRYLGYTDNGNPTLYPGYKEDQTRAFAWARSLGGLPCATPARSRSHPPPCSLP